MKDQKPIKLLVSVINPEQIIYEGEAESLTSVNVFGRFDILPYHINFISIIEDILIIRDTGKQERQMKIDGGIMKVLDNKVSVFLGIEIFKENH